MSKTITPQYLSPLKICGGKTFLSPSFFLPFDLMKSLASSIPGAVISTTSTSMPRPSRIIKILPWCVTIWKKGGNFKIWFLQKRVGKLPMFSKNRWKKLVLIDNKSLCGRKWKRKEFQGHSWISSSFQPRHFFQLIRKYFEENSQNQILVFSSFTI